MYNRYIQQNDGSYRRSRIPDSMHVQEQKKQPEGPPAAVHPAPIPPRPHRKPEPQSPLAFFRQLIPRELDTEDLIILLLLLLMSGDCREDQNTALLTLVLYLFL